MSKQPILVLAPMAGITDSAFRQICKKFGADLVYTEMISADALHHDNARTLEMLKFSKKEKPVVCQLFGSKIEKFPKACKIVEQAGFDGIDLNFGCPVKKIAKQGSGVTLMKDLNKCKDIISTVIKSTKLPVSVKTRKSIGKTTVIDFIKKIKPLDIKTIMIHGRSYEKPFAGEIDFEIIKQATKKFKGIVLANGGINTSEDAIKALEKTGAHGIGLARGVFGRPWLFQEIKQTLGVIETSSITTLQQKKKIILQHARLSKNDLLSFRKHLLAYTKGWPNSRKLREQLMHASSISEIEKILNNVKH